MPCRLSIAAHLDPETSPLAHGRQLGRLHVREAKRGLCAVLLSELGQSRNDNGQLGDDQIISHLEEDQIGVVSDVAGSSAEMDNLLSSRADTLEDVHMGHDIVSSLLLLFGSGADLLVVEVQVGPHLVNCLLRDIEAELLLCNGEIQPEEAPRLEPHCV